MEPGPRETVPIPFKHCVNKPLDDTTRYVLDAVVVCAGGAPKAGAGAAVVAGVAAPNVRVALEPPNGAAGVGAPND